MRDVVIVGGGPVGMFLASLLTLRGLDVLVLEQRTQPSMRSRAIGIHPPSLSALETIGVAEELLAKSIRIRVGEVYCDGRRMGRLSFEKAAPAYPFVAALPQYETEALLRARFDQLRPDGVRGGVRVTGVREIDGGVQVLAEDGATIAARYVVGADGSRSAVRESVGIGWRSLGRRETYLMADYPDADADAGAGAGAGGDARVGGQTSSSKAAMTHAGSRTDARPRAGAVSSSLTKPSADEVAVLYFERGGVVESFPLPGRRRRWVAMTDGLQTGAVSADLAAVIRARTSVELPISADPPSPFVVQQRLADRMVTGRIVLIGDAAHEVSPIGGQGMNLGWLDAVALAPALQRAVQDPASATSALVAFDTRRRRAARMAARQAAFNMTMGRPADGIRLRTRNALVRVLALPPARSVLARAFTMRWL